VSPSFVARQSWLPEIEKTCIGSIIKAVRCAVWGWRSSGLLPKGGKRELRRPFGYRRGRPRCGECRQIRVENVNDHKCRTTIDRDFSRRPKRPPEHGIAGVFLMAQTSEKGARRPAAGTTKAPREPGQRPRRTGKAAPEETPAQSAIGSSPRHLTGEYLAVELGHAADDEGEPLGLDFPVLRSDPEFRKLGVSLWRQMQATKAASTQLRELQEQGLTSADLWEPGVVEFLPTNSTPEQVRRYKQKLLFRARLLEAVLTETVAELKWLDRLRPIPEGQQSG
jgi:hypothetical protein